MSRLKELLYSDLARQYELEGRSGIRPNFLRFLARLLHFRFLPNVLCRTSRAAMLVGIPLLPNLLTYLNLVLFGLEVTPKCEIGAGIFFAHPVGSVIGAWQVGSNVTVFQGVTLGSKRPDMKFDPSLRPQIGNNVMLGTGCKVLGGIHIGDNVTVGANSVILNSVGPNQTVFGIPARARSAAACESEAQK
jgi:serine O-acetyltransferase